MKAMEFALRMAEAMEGKPHLFVYGPFEIEGTEVAHVVWGLAASRSAVTFHGEGTEFDLAEVIGEAKALYEPLA